MFNRFIPNQRGLSAQSGGDRCSNCGSTLQRPPSIETLRNSQKAAKLTINTSINRSLPACRLCAYTTAQAIASQLPNPYEFAAAQTKIIAKIEEANSLIYNPDLDEATKAQLRMGKARLEEQRAELASQERDARRFMELKNEITQIVDLRTQGIRVDELSKALEVNQERRLAFEAEWEQEDDEGNPVAAGSYTVRGILNTEPPEKLETDPRPLVISP